MSLISGTVDRGTAESAEPNKNHGNICFYYIFNNGCFKAIVTSDKFMNKFVNKTQIPLSNLWIEDSLPEAHNWDRGDFLL